MYPGGRRQRLGDQHSRLTATAHRVRVHWWTMVRCRAWRGTVHGIVQRGEAQVGQVGRRLHLAQGREDLVLIHQLQAPVQAPIPIRRISRTATPN